MEIIVEDGSNVAGANSYVSLTDADTYHEARQNTSWVQASNDAKTGAILRAMAYLESVAWAGMRVLRDQALMWPRAGVVDRDGYELASNAIPRALVSALCELALREVSSPGSTSPDLERGGMVKREKVDVLEVEYQDGAPGVTVFTVVDRLLVGLKAPRGSFEIGRG